MRQADTENQKGKHVRGVFEREPGSGDWWIRFTDSEGRLRREKVGSKSAAKNLYALRKVEARQGKKLPANLRSRTATFGELCDDYLTYATANNEGANVDKYRIAAFKTQFGNRAADIPIADLRQWFDQHEWAPATFNRTLCVLGLIYKLGMENGKVVSNPARLFKHRKEPDGRVRFLNQYAPDEEDRVRRIILRDYPEHMPEFEIALNTGMRAGEQYSRIDWTCVDFLRTDLFIPVSKTGPSRHIPLSDEARMAFQVRFARTGGKGAIFRAERGNKPLLGARHWFEEVIAAAVIPDFTWHDLRHTFASRLVMAGVDIRTVAQLMRHKKIQMTMRYAHLAKSHTDDAVRKMAAFNASEREKQQNSAGADILTPAENLETQLTPLVTPRKNGVVGKDQRGFKEVIYRQ